VHALIFFFKEISFGKSFWNLLLILLILLEIYLDTVDNLNSSPKCVTTALIWILQIQTTDFEFYISGLTIQANLYYKILISWTSQKVKETYATRNAFDFKHGNSSG